MEDRAGRGSAEQQLIDLSNQILSLTKDVRAFAGKAQEDNEQNKELLDLSKQTLALTRDVTLAPAPLKLRTASSTDSQSPRNGRSSQ